MNKTIEVEGLDVPVVIARRLGTRSLRLSVRSDGRVRLTVPYGVGERQAYDFLKSKVQWINKHHKLPAVLGDSHHIGKSWRLRFEQTSGDTVRTRLKNNEIIIRLPVGVNPNEHTVQTLIRAAAERALKTEASHLLPQRVEHLAAAHRISYRSCNVKKLKSRWGSCDNRNNIVLNIYLTQLEWRLIDYVILHELTHTIHKHHQTDFWTTLESFLPDYKQRRKELRAHPTNVINTAF